MSPDHSDWVRQAYEAFRRRDSDALGGLMDPDVEFRTTVETAHGLAGVEDWVRQMDELFDDFQIEVEETVEAGDRVVVLVHERARAKASGLDVDMRIGHVWTLRDGRAVAMRAYPTHAEALAAVGA
jgi:ketosteroid isomerase-like protein